MFICINGKRFRKEMIDVYYLVPNNYSNHERGSHALQLYMRNGNGFAVAVNDEEWEEFQEEMGEETRDFIMF